MNLEQLTALFIAVGGLVTALSTWVKNKGDKKRSSIDEWKELSETYKADYQDIRKKFIELEERIDERDYQHQLERNQWKQERENMIRVNGTLSNRITVLEEALIQEGIDVDEL